MAVVLGSAVNAQQPPDCTVGHLLVGGLAPKITHAEYEKRRSGWFEVVGAKNYRSLVTSGKIPFEQYVAIKDGHFLAIIREFTTNYTRDVVDALRARYGEPKPTGGGWIDWTGDASGAQQLTWFDERCGIRIDALPSGDPDDWDERTVIVWTLGAFVPRPAVDEAIH